MEQKELKEKSREDLEKMLREHREELRESNFRVHRGEEKGVHHIRVLRKDIARILTTMNTQK
jgi:ribosomal protein L29